MAVESILDAWIDANLLLCLLVALWLPIRRFLAPGRLGQAAMGQARSLEWVLLAVLLTPILSRAFAGSPVETLNLSNLLVAHYLDGNVEMSAIRFEAILGLREDIVGAFLNQRAPWAQGLLAFLVIGAAAHILRLGLAALRLHGLLRRAHDWRRFGRLKLVISDEVRVPFSTCGIWNRYIVLPVDVLGHGRDLHFALAHEIQHLRQHDLAYEFAIEALRPFFFWNPAFRLYCRHLRELREIACDQALAMRRPSDLGGYCRSLIRASVRARDAGAVFVPAGPAVGFVGAGQGAGFNSQLGRRIVALTGNTPSASGQTTWKAIGLVLCGVLVMGAVLLRSPSGWSHDRIMLSTIVNLERLDERNSILAQDAVTLGAQGVVSATW